MRVLARVALDWEVGHAEVYIHEGLVVLDWDVD